MLSRRAGAVFVGRSMTDRHGLSSEEERRLDALLAAAHDVGAGGLVVATSGNFSVRFRERLFAISASGSRLATLRREELVAVSSATGEARSGLLGEEAGMRCSLETPMHTAVHRVRDDARAVLHFQSPAATSLACREETMPDLDLIPEFPAYIRKASRVPYHRPGSEELARAVAASLGDPDVRVVQLTNHGQIAIGETPEQAASRAAFFELSCRVYLLSEARELRRLDPEQIEELREYGSRDSGRM